MAKLSFEQIVRILGDENESAVESLFDRHQWGDEVALDQFLPEWTELVEQGTRMLVEMELLLG